MALIEYEWRGQTWQFDEADAPADAVPVESAAASEPVSEDEPGEGAGQGEEPGEGAGQGDEPGEGAGQGDEPGEDEKKGQTKRAAARNKAARPSNK